MLIFGLDWRDTLRATLTIASISLACLATACGNGGPRPPENRGSVSVDGICFELGGARGSVLNTPRAVYWAGVAMPALARIDIFGMDVQVDDAGLALTEATPTVTMLFPSGPRGDFFAGRPSIPSSMEMQLGNIKVFVPESLLAGCRATLSASPLDTGMVDLELLCSFDRGDSHYDLEYEGTICFPGVALPPSPPAYPAWQAPDTLFFEMDGMRFQPYFFAAVEGMVAGQQVYTVYAFTEPFQGTPPSKATQTCLRFTIPIDLVDGHPVNTGVDAFVFMPGDTLSRSATRSFCWAEATVDGRVVTGRMQFQGNGSEPATRFLGGGRFTAPIK